MMRMMQHEHELTHAQSEQLACKCLLEKAEACKQLTKESIKIGMRLIER